MAHELASTPVMFMAKKEVLKNCAWLCPTPKAPMTCGMATLTIELVKIEVKNAASAAAVASQRAVGENLALVPVVAATAATAQFATAIWADA